MRFDLFTPLRHIDKSSKSLLLRTIPTMNLHFSSQKKNIKRGDKALQIIPGVGPSMSKDLNDIGVLKVSDLVGKNPEKLFAKLERIREAHIDRCVLYVFRCAVYFAEHKNPNPEKLKWWNWKD